MRKFGVFAAVMAAIAVSVTGCGSKPATAEPAAEPAQEAPAAETAAPAAQAVPEEEDTQNPVMNFVGVYSDKDSGFSLFIEPTDGVDGAHISVGHTSEDGMEYKAWEITGRFKDNVIPYSNAICFKQTYNPEAEDPQNSITQEDIYSDGTGSFEISADSKITWKDDKENAGEGLVFEWDQERTEQLQQLMQQNQDEDTTSDGMMAMDWAGPYKAENDENLTMEIKVGEDGVLCEITISKKGEGSKAQRWQMKAPYDPEKKIVEYAGASKADVELNEIGEVISSGVIYEDGTGTFTFDPESMTITWKDDKEDAGKDVVFAVDYNTGGTEEGAGEGYELMEGEVVGDPEGAEIPEADMSVPEEPDVDQPEDTNN